MSRKFALLDDHFATASSSGSSPARFLDLNTSEYWRCTVRISSEKDLRI